MKTRSLNLRTVLTSAYLSAMLASSVAPVRSDATLAAAIDPSAARSALASAVATVNASGWSDAKVAPAKVAEPAMTAPQAAPAADPTTTELIARLTKRAIKAQTDSVIDASIARIFGLGDGSANLPAKTIFKILPEGKYLFVIAMKNGAPTGDSIIALNDGPTIHSFLIDKDGNLRSAALTTNTTIQPVTIDAASTAQFKSTLTVLTNLAQALPPTGGTTVAAAGS